jgi:histidinol dehydrogenase
VDIIKYPKKEDWPDLIKRPELKLETLTRTVSSILEDVKNNGDEAVKRLTLRFDKANLKSFIVSAEEIDEACKHISPKLAKAIEKATENIEKFHKAQLHDEQKVETSRGVFCWRKNVPIEKVGLYIPGGTAPLFSTVLMLAIPAKLAGCSKIILCTPPNPAGQIHPAILFAAQKIGVTKIIKAGGAQAIAAMAYGTKSIPSVDKIFGPGNQYVTAAKLLVSTQGVAIDMPAGPSEVLVIADHTANEKYIAADLLSQAEHGPDSQVLLVTNQPDKVQLVQKEINKQLKKLPRMSIAAKALENSKTVLFETIEECVAFSNTYAPEHLIICVERAEQLADKINQAGSVFLGNYTPEAAGDYASGTNHVLPTNGFARSYAGVSTDSFIKKITFQQITKKGLGTLGPSIEILAEAEELDAHRKAVSFRLEEK